MNDRTDYTANEFESESRYLETLIWESLVVERGMRVLVCGYGPEGALVKRAIASGALTTVIEHRNEEIARFAPLGAKLLRGSTSVIPAKEASFDVAIAYHYLHEIDPFFHAQVLSELARVAKRVAIVEPAPPADPLGKRIALLYSQAKRELGSFEYYQPLEYWKKLLQAVKADVSQHVFAFSKTPPLEYLRDTVKLLIDTIELEEAPREYVDELRAIAQRSDAVLLPPPRYVLVGAAAGELIAPTFSQRSKQAISAKPSRVPATASEIAKKIEAARDVSQAAGYEFPPVEAPRP
ncbi:MAG: class I SAM-dependent methyltransferase, partial [bacterium]|nr:class I SAM-dependent methyltransferase [bacterium]